MTCTHDKSLKCQTCHPELWKMTDDELLAVNYKILQRIVMNLLMWKRAYYLPEHPDVDKHDTVPDVRYDTYESALKKQFPDHPVLKMVGYDETQKTECLSYFREMFGFIHSEPS